MKPVHLLAASAAISLCLAAGLIGAWVEYGSASEFAGRYHSSGKLLLSDGRDLRLEYSLLLKNDRFYAMTRQGDTVQRTAGSVESSFLGHLRLRVDKSELSELSQARATDNELLFDLLYGGESNNVIDLVPQGECLFAEETRQLFCPERYAGDH